MKEKNVKAYIILLLMALVIQLSGCTNNDVIDEFVEYNIGDEVTINGIIYQYVDFTDRANEYKPFSFDESSENDIIHTFYYYDMTNENQAPITGYDLFNLHDIDDYEMIFKATEPKYNFQIDQYFPLHKFLYEASIVGQSGFVVKGYTDKISRKVTIIDSINRNPVVAIGYKALSGAKMESLIIKPLVAVLPYAISDCESLKTIDFEIPATLLSCAIANNPNLTRVTRVDNLSDACFYNLSNLTEVMIKRNPTYWVTIPLFHSGCLNSPEFNSLPNPSVFKRFGVYKAPFYLCGNLTSFTGDVEVRDNVVYFCSESYVRDPIYVMNTFKLMCRYSMSITGVANHEEKTIVPNIFITGYPVKGTITIVTGEFADSFTEIDEEMYYLQSLYVSRYNFKYLEDIDPYLIISDLTNYYL